MDITPAQDASRLRLVGRYQLVSPVVSGALGDLWRAKIASGPEEGRVVLVRLIPRTTAVDAKAVERLTNAGFAAMELRHAKIAAVLDVVVADAEIAVVSEHIGGAALQAVVRQQGPKRVHATPAIALRIVADMLEAVDAVRAPWAELTADPRTDDERLLASGIHGGLIPDDLLVATFGETMLLECGLAGIAMTLPAISDHPEVVAYRAPEQMETKGPIDERADIFTAAVIAWELLAGRSLFGPMVLPRPAGLGGPPKAKPLAEAAQTSAVKRKVLSAPIQRLDTLPALKGKITKELSSWVARCLERDRDARYQTIREALTELYAQGPAAIAPADDVAKWIAASGVALVPTPDSADTESGPVSNRPTAPPVEDARRETASAAPTDDPATLPGTAPRGTPRGGIHLKATASTGQVSSPGADAAGTSRRVAAGDISKLTVESLMPSDSVPPPPRADAESVPPSSSDVPPASVDAPTLPPVARSSAGAESVPPSSVDAPTLPPAAAKSSADVESVRPSFDVESVPPLSTGARMPSPVAIPIAEGVTESRSPVITEEPTSAPVVRGVAEPPDEGSEDEAVVRGIARQASSRKIVAYVVGGAALLAVIGGLRLILSGHETQAPGPSVSAAVTASAAPASVLPRDEPRAEPKDPPPPSSAAALPTLAPSPGGAAVGARPPIDSVPNSSANARRPAGPKRKTYRPTGI